MSKIYVYTKDTVIVNKALDAALTGFPSDPNPEDFIVVRDIRSFVGKKHKDKGIVYATDSQTCKKLDGAELFEISDSMSADERYDVINKLRHIVREFIDKSKQKDISILDIDISSLPDILDRDKIAAFIEQYKKAYKKPIVITTNDSNTIGVFDNTSDFEENKNKYDVLLTVDEYITIMLTTLGFNAKMIKIERNKEDDET